MKKILVSIALLLSVTAFAQVDNFSVSDGKVYWQRVYPTDLSHEELLDVIVKAGTFMDILDGDVITFRIVRGKIDFKELGFSRGSLPMYVSGNDVSCFVTVQIKDGKYRVTVDNIILTENVTAGVFKEGTENQLETYALKQGELTSGFQKKPSKVYNGFFSNLFLFQNKSYIDDEW
ncbi:MAG: hypothetical protein IKW89_05720 [Bacteroidales bacterium]|nr:hypothetical protein [Bacteroidales bacterium]